MYKTNKKKYAKGLKAITFAIAILENKQFESAPKIISHFGGTNNISLTSKLNSKVLRKSGLNV